MRTPKRRINPGVIEQLLDAPYRFGFFQAVRVLEQWFAKRSCRAAAGLAVPHAASVMPRDGSECVDFDHESKRRSRDVLAYHVSFRNTLSLAFPPSEIEKLRAFDRHGRWIKEKAARDSALNVGCGEQVDHIAITPAFFGLLGVQGALPLHYTDQIAGREVSSRDYAARAFFDIFSNRATALFYGAWKKYRLALHYELDRNERFMPYLLALAGVDRNMRQTLPHEASIHFDEAMTGYAAALRQKAMSATYLRRVLADYFDVPVEIEQFVGKWYGVQPEQLTKLGACNTVLGESALVGERIWQRNMCVGLVLGPLTMKQYRLFLKGAANVATLRKVLQLTAGMEVEYDIRLVLRREDVAPCRLGASGCLGQDAFLTTQDAPQDRRDARYGLDVMSPCI